MSFDTPRAEPHHGVGVCIDLFVFTSQSQTRLISTTQEEELLPVPSAIIIGFLLFSAMARYASSTEPNVTTASPAGRKRSSNIIVTASDVSYNIRDNNNNKREVELEEEEERGEGGSTLSRALISSHFLRCLLGGGQRVSLEEGEDIVDRCVSGHPLHMDLGSLITTISCGDYWCYRM